MKRIRYQFDLILEEKGGKSYGEIVADVFRRHADDLIAHGAGAPSIGANGHMLYRVDGAEIAAVRWEAKPD